MSDSINHTQTNVVRYFFIDGSLEFSLALVSAVLAGYFLIEARLSGFVRVLIDVSLVLILFLGSVLMRRIIRFIKEHVTYKRTGYLEYRRKKANSIKQVIIRGILFGGLAALLTSFFIIVNPDGFDVIPLINGLGFFTVLSLFGWRARIYHFFLLAGLCLLAGIGSATVFMSAGLSGFYLMISILMLLSGGTTLWIYILRNPVQETTQDEK